MEQVFKRSLPVGQCQREGVKRKARTPRAQRFGGGLVAKDPTPTMDYHSWGHAHIFYNPLSRHSGLLQCQGGC